MILDGKLVASRLEEYLKSDIKTLEGTPCLAVVVVGEDPASQTYVRNKQKACERVGIKSIAFPLAEDITQEKLEELIECLNQDSEVTGILVQLPLPKKFDESRVTRLIDPKKDVDGFHPINVGKLHLGNPDLLPCTPSGIMEMLNFYDVCLEGKHCVIVGRSNLVGRPLAELLLKRNATVTVAHSKTLGLRELCNSADILVCAIGKPKFFDITYVKMGSIVIDVGINRDDNGHLCGDVDFDSVKGLAYAITPVPGGVGRTTVAMLLRNCVKAFRLQQE